MQSSRRASRAFRAVLTNRFYFLGSAWPFFFTICFFMSIISLCCFIIVSVFLYKIEKELFVCMYRRCSLAEFAAVYRSANYSRLMIFVQISFTLVMKFVFLDKIDRKEKNLQKLNLSPAKFTVILMNLSKKWTREHIRRFFIKGVNSHLAQRRKRLESTRQGALDPLGTRR